MIQEEPIIGNNFVLKKIKNIIKILLLYPIFIVFANNALSAETSGGNNTAV